MRYVFLIALFFVTGCFYPRYSGCQHANLCEYQDPIMLKHSRSHEVVVCRPESDVLLETCARGYEKKGFVRMSEYPMKVPGAIRIDDKYYSSSY